MGIHPKISIIIPIYNVEKYLSRCLKSVIAQSFIDFEAICVNDGSQDNSEEIVKNYAKKDKRIKIITQENLGLSMARNNGIKKAKGEYIYFLDSDDFIHPQLLEICYNYALKHKVDLVEFDFFKNKNEEYSLENIKKINSSKLKYKKTNNPIFLGTYNEKFKISFNVWSKLYKKELVKDLSFIPNIHFEDCPHTFAVLSKKPQTLVIDAELYFYTLNKNSISNKKANPQQIKDYHTGVNYIYDTYKKTELKKELSFLKRNFIPNILKQQFNRCKRASEDVQGLMWQAFREELKDLNKKNLISWRGHKLSRYFIYKKLIKG
ncbi:MAG: glycosyltransferase [Alphaproteobacteria bacterium]